MKRILSIFLVLNLGLEPLPAIASGIVPGSVSPSCGSSIQSRIDEEALLSRALWFHQIFGPIASPLVRQLRRWTDRHLRMTVESMGRMQAHRAATSAGRWQNPFRVRDSVPDKPVDVIVAVGCGLRADGTASLNSVEVAKRARDLLHLGRAPKILLSGGYRENGISEEEAMRAVLRSEGVDPAQIVLANGPDYPSSTHLQPAAVAAVLRQNYKGIGRPQVLLVGHPAHLPRALWLFRRALPDVDFYPANAAPAYDAQAAQIRLYNGFFFQVWNLIAWGHHWLFPPIVSRLSSRNPPVWLIGPDPDIPRRPAVDSDVLRGLTALDTSSRAVFIGSAKADGLAAAHETATRWMRGEIPNQPLHPHHFIVVDCRRFIEEHGENAVTTWQDLVNLLNKAKGQVGVILNHAESALSDITLAKEATALLLSGRIPVLATTDFSGYQRLETDPHEAIQIPFIITTPTQRTKRPERVLIIGASGFLGETMFHVFTEHYQTVHGTAYSKPIFVRLDVTHPEEVARTLQSLHPDVVVYAAGEVAADDAAVDRTRSFQLNAGIVDTIADHFRGKFVYISSDYVFDGQDATRPYSAVSPTAPITYYGETKVAGEYRTEARFPEGLVLRIGALYGFNRSGDKNTTARAVMQNLENGADMVMDAEQIKRPISTRHVADTLLRLLGHDASGIYQISGNRPVTKLDWAVFIQQMVRSMSPLSPVDISAAREPPSIPRPFNTEMVNTDSPGDIVEGHREMLRESGLVWTIFTRAWESASHEVRLDQRHLTPLTLGGRLWNIMIPQAVEAAYHIALQSSGAVSGKRNAVSDIPAMVEILDNFRRPELQARGNYGPNSTPGIEVLPQTPLLFHAPIAWQADTPDMRYGTSVSDSVGVVRFSATTPSLLSAGLGEITAQIPSDIPFSLLIRRAASDQFDSAVVFHDRMWTANELDSFAARLSPVRSLTDAAYRSIERGAWPAQNYAYAPVQRDVEDSSGLNYSIILNQGRYEYVSRTVRAAAQKPADPNSSTPSAPKKVVIPHSVAPGFQKCLLCDPGNTVITSRVEFSGETYQLLINPNPWGRHHVLLTTAQPVAQRLFPWHLKGTLEFLARMGQSYEAIYNGVQAAASIFHFHAQVHEGHSSIWRNFDGGRLKPRSLVKGPVLVSEVTGWPARAYLIEGTEAGPTSTVAARMVAQLERQNLPQNLSMRVQNGRYQIILFDRNLQTEKPQGIDSDTNSWSRYGGMEMGGTLFLLTPAAFGRLAGGEAAGQKLRGALTQLSAGPQEAETFIRDWTKGGTGLMAPAKKGVFIFDVDGTLADRNQPLPPKTIEALILWLRSGARVVMTTGQDLSLDQQDRLSNIFPRKLRHLLTIYANEGATKYEFDRSGAMAPDEVYNQYFELSAEEKEIIYEEMSHLATEKGISLIMEPRIWSGAEVVCKVSTDPETKSYFARELAARLNGRGMGGLRISLSGRTSVAVFRGETGKLMAIRDIVDSTPGLRVEDLVYFGDEVRSGGNDEDVLHIPGLTVVAVNPDQTDVTRGARAGGRGIQATRAWISFLMRERPRHGSMAESVRSFQNTGAPAESSSESQIKPTAVHALFAVGAGCMVLSAGIIGIGYIIGIPLHPPMTAVIVASVVSLFVFLPGVFYFIELGFILNANSSARHVRNGMTSGPDFTALEVFRKNLERTYDVQIVPKNKAPHIAYVNPKDVGNDVIMTDLLALYYLPSLMVDAVLRHEKFILSGKSVLQSYRHGGWVWAQWIWTHLHRSHRVGFKAIVTDPNERIVRTKGLGLIALGAPAGTSNLYGFLQQQPQTYLLPEYFTAGGESMVALGSIVNRNTRAYSPAKLKIVGTADQVGRIRDYLQACNQTDKTDLNALPVAQQVYLQKEMAILAARRPDGSRAHWSDFVRFIELKEGESWSSNGVSITLGSLGHYRIDEGYKHQTLGRRPLVPLQAVFRHLPTVTSIPEFGVTFLGSSDGIGPRGLPTSYIIWAGQRGILVDPANYTLSLLEAMKIDVSRITDVVLTHAHETHCVGLLPLLSNFDQRKARIRVMTSPVIQLNIVRQLDALLGAEEAGGLLKRTVEWVGAVPGVPLSIGRHAAITFQFSLHDVPTLMGRVRFHNREIAFSGDHLYDPARLSEWSGGGLPLAVRQEIEGIDPGIPEPIDPLRRQVLERFLIEGPPNLTIHDFGGAPGERGAHTSIDAFLALPPEVRSQIFGVHRQGLGGTDTSIPWGYAGLTIVAKNRDHTPLSDYWLGHLRRKIAQGLSPDDYNRIDAPLQAVPEGSVEALGSKSVPQAPLRVAVGISAGGLSEFANDREPFRELTLPEIDDNPHSLLEWKLGAVRKYEIDGGTGGRPIPVFLLTSPLNERAIKDLLFRENNFGFPENEIHLLPGSVIERTIPGAEFQTAYLEQRVLEISKKIASGLLPVSEGEMLISALRQRAARDYERPGTAALDDEGQPSVNPVGHWEFIRTLVISGALAELARSRIELIYHSNLTNPAATLDKRFSALCAKFAETRHKAEIHHLPAPIMQAELVRNDRKQSGSYLVRVGGPDQDHLELVKDSVLKASGLSSEKCGYIHTGNALLSVDGLLNFFKLDRDYDKNYSRPEIASLIDQVFLAEPEMTQTTEEGTETFPNGEQARISFPVFQFERNLDELTAKAPWVAIDVTGADRFVPLRRQEDLVNAEETLPRILAGKVDVGFSKRPMSVSAQELEHLCRHPLVFLDNLVSYAWGGTWITRFKRLGFQDRPIAESWEVSGHPRFPSRLALSGGRTIELPHLIQIAGERILGHRIARHYQNRMPLLTKFLDTHLTLSVQVHPSDEVAHALGERDTGKEEIFYVVGVEHDDAKIFLGLRDGVDEAAFRHAVESGKDLTLLMNPISVLPGEVYRIPSGTVHAWSGGVELAELAQASDLTYRLYDFNRKQRTRPLHPEKGLAAMNFKAPTGEELVLHLRRPWEPTGKPHVEFVRVDPSIGLERVLLDHGEQVKGTTGEDFVILQAIHGHLEVIDEVGSITHLVEGHTILLPAAMGEYHLRNIGPVRSEVLRIRTVVPEAQVPVHVAVSAGGTKLKIGATDPHGLLAQGRRVFWFETLNHRGLDVNAANFIDLIAREIMDFLQRFNISVRQVLKVGVAWPGPVDELRGTVSATFIPGFIEYPLSIALSRVLGELMGHSVPVQVVFDAATDLIGELKGPGGVMRGKVNGMVLNIATGIAAGLLMDGKIVDQGIYSPPGSPPLKIERSLGQLGRHLFRQKDGSWIYRPTSDGAIPPYDPAMETRWTDLNGGPALSRRYVASAIEKFGLSDTAVLGSELGDLQKALQIRNEALEMQILHSITQTAAGISSSAPFAKEFIDGVARDIGHALKTFAAAYPEAHYLDRVILVGGIGENLGETSEGSSDPRGDSFLNIILETSGARFVSRAKQGVEREILSFMPPKSLSELVVPLNNGVTWETYEQFLDALAALSLDAEPEILTMHMLTPDGRRMHYIRMLPRQVFTAYPEYLARALALHANIQGEMTGIQAVWLTTAYGAPVKDLLARLQATVQSEFPSTIERANYGAPIQWLEEPPVTTPLPPPDREFPPVSMHLGHAIGVDTGGADVKIALLQEGVITARRRLSQKIVGGPQLGTAMEQAIVEIWTQAGLPLSELWAAPLVIGVPGSVTPAGKLAALPNLEGRYPGSMASLEAFRKRHPQAEFINDANMAGEFYVRTSNLGGTVVLNTLGTGLGVAIIQNGRRMPGLSESHIRIDLSPLAPRHSCGNQGCLENVTNSDFVVRRAMELMELRDLSDERRETLTPRDVIGWLKDDPRHQDIATQIFHELGENIGVLQAIISDLLGENKLTVILAGGLAQPEARDIIMAGIRQKLQSLRPDVQIEGFSPPLFPESNEFDLTATPPAWIGASAAALLGLSAQKRPARSDPAPLLFDGEDDSPSLPLFIVAPASAASVAKAGSWAGGSLQGLLPGNMGGLVASIAAFLFSTPGAISSLIIWGRYFGHSLNALLRSGIAAPQRLRSLKNREKWAA